MTIQNTALLLVVVAELLGLYTFSFKSFTFQVGERLSKDKREVKHIQFLLTPRLMGTAYLTSLVLLAVTTVMLGIAFHWWIGVAYLFFHGVAVKPLLPLFQWRRHFARLATQTLLKRRDGALESTVALLAETVELVAYQPSA